eukprot:s157_g15.t1
MASPPVGPHSGGSIPHGHPVLAAMWLAALPHDGGEGRAQQVGGPMPSMGSQSQFSQLISKSSSRASQKVPNEPKFLQKQNWKIESQLLQQEFKAKAAVQQATKRERGSPHRKYKGKAKRNRQGKSGPQRDGGHGIQGVSQPSNGKRSLDDITQMARDAGWVESARRRLKTKLYSKATLATKDSKRRRISEIMESCCITIGNDGLSQEDLLTIAAVLGEAGLKSADQYLGEVKLLQLESGISWPDVMERQMTMVKRALRRDVGPDCRAREFNPENISDDIWEMKTTRKGSPVRIAWSYSWATIWMLRCVELAQLRAKDIDLDFKKRRVSLHIRKSKTDQAAQGVRRTLKCCGRQSCERFQVAKEESAKAERLRQRRAAKTMDPEVQSLAQHLHQQHRIKLLCPELASHQHNAFEEFRMKFLQDFGSSIGAGLQSCYQGEVELRCAPMSKHLQSRFLSCKEKQEEQLCPVLHGTEDRNLPSIYQKGLLVPTGQNNVRVLNGSSHGKGIYTAKTQNTALSFGFSKGLSRPLLICGALDDAVVLPKPVQCGNHFITAESASVRHVGDAIVVFDESKLLPLFVASSPGILPPLKPGPATVPAAPPAMAPAAVAVPQAQVAGTAAEKCQKRIGNGPITRVTTAAKTTRQLLTMAFLSRRGARKRRP